MAYQIGHAGPLPQSKRSEALEDSWVGFCIENGALLFLLCLIYKLAAVGAVILAGIIAVGMLLPRKSFFLTPPGIFGILYVALMTLTAFMVSASEGAYRTIQFLLVLGSTIVVANYFARISSQRVRLFTTKLLIIGIAVFVHVIYYHLSTGRYFTWKYLYDAKFCFSLCVLLFFIKEDEIKGRLGPALWAGAIGLLTVLILISGERKAYLLLALLFLLSNASLLTKLLVLVIGSATLGSYVSLAPEGDYVARQILTLTQSTPELRTSEFFAITNLADYSDLIREFVNRQANELFHQHPIFGMGATGYQHWARNAYGDLPGGFAMNVHGETHRLPVENGLVGIAIVLTYALTLALNIWNYLRRVGGFGTASTAKTPLYIFGFMLLYLTAEAADTLMFSLIMLFGFYVSSLPGLGRYRPAGPRVIEGEVHAPFLPLPMRAEIGRPH
ncbi:hypothetical protein CLG96_03115 [Sphingomonas oleivorans]|uniref:O-antigen ligase-related domain-containing protein n=1 Tax=Sphingomonas oleivorans TaxID=1735121 RepID=A0A2T5G1W6_9SPHN|nr:O-antigen ligase family protein [Sphingomonas oleivorans]PTQ13135.1 hypothetical protein CLG96_03115 [Sphingomonas oleivorans]